VGQEWKNFLRSSAEQRESAKSSTREHWTLGAENDAEKKAYEERVQRRLKILKQQFEQGKIYIAEGLKVIDSLRAVRELPDGTIDLSTVDGLVRSMALMAEHMHDREELKKANPLADIQKAYFDFLHTNFGHFYDIMVERRLTPHQAARGLSSNERSRAELLGPISDFLKTIDEFWDATGEIAHWHVEDLHGALKGVFGGDLFPSHSENLASKTGIYLDTLILPDPFLRSKTLFGRWDDERRAYYLVKHALNLLRYRELACAPVSPPIVVVIPDLAELQEGEKNFFLELGKQDAIKHGARVFGRKFASFEEMMEFAGALETIDKVLAEVKDPDRVLFDTEWSGTFAEKLQRASTGSNAALLGTQHPGQIVAAQALGRMSVSNELLIKSRRLRGTPTIDAETSWRYLVWKLEYDAAEAEHTSGLHDLHVVRGLQSLGDGEMQWLGNVPPAALIEVRQSGAIQDIRELLGKGLQELITANPTNFYRTTDQIFDNINAAFDLHKASIAELSAKKWKFAGSEIGSWLVVGSLAVTAAATGLPVWGLAAIVADQLLNAPKLKDIPNSVRKLAEESQQLKLSPVGMLFKLKNKQQ
jgi:hypothetical protein